MGRIKINVDTSRGGKKGMDLPSRLYCLGLSVCLAGWAAGHMAILYCIVCVYCRARARTAVRILCNSSVPTLISTSLLRTDKAHRRRA